MGKHEVTEWLKSNKKRYISGGDVFHEYQRRKAIEWAMAHLECEDIVEVVRCKDCKHHNVFRLECHNEHMNGYIGMNGFCSYGERKDNE